MQGEFLEETIRSVLLQGVPQLEYIVMDGGSRDETVAILKKYEPWLACWRSEKDRGQVDAINKGLAVASGEIVAYLNSDDWYHPGALQAVVRRAAAHPEESWWVGWVDNRTEGQPPDRKPSTFTNMVEFMGRTEAMQQPGVFWRKGLEEQVGLFDPTMHFVFDHEYFVRFARLGIRPVDLQVPIANFRIHGGSKTYSKQYLFMRELWDSTRRHRDAVTPAEWPEVVRRVRQYEAHYFVQSVYGVLEKGDRWAAIGYLLRSLALAPLVKPLRLYLGAWCRVLFAGRPPEWFGQAPASSR
jgi:glycosyltransferase involved in cell wall biosynthesis